MYFLSNALYNWDCASPIDPFANDRNWPNSLLPPLSNPSAILSITEPVDRLIWSFKAKSLQAGVLRKTSNSSFENLRAFRHASISSKCLNVAILFFKINQTQTPNPKLGTRNPEPETRNPELEIRNLNTIISQRLNHYTNLPHRKPDIFRGTIEVTRASRYMITREP
jgi:hypothetical protein